MGVYGSILPPPTMVKLIGKEVLSTVLDLEEVRGGVSAGDAGIAHLA